MKTYKVELVYEPDVCNLVNIENEQDCIMAAPDEFQIGEILSEDEFVIKKANYVDEQGVGTGNFAFRAPIPNTNFGVDGL